MRSRSIPRRRSRRNLLCLAARRHGRGRASRNLCRRRRADRARPPRREPDHLPERRYPGAGLAERQAAGPLRDDGRARALSADAAPRLLRRLGLFDATMLVMGGIVGAGIFVNPAEVARAVHSPWAIVGAWVLGGAVALAGALVYAELAVRRPETGGQYAYLRDAWGPVPAFLYGWSLLLVI